MFEIIILASTCIANLVLGLLVYQKNPRSVTNRSFLFLTLVFALWSTLNYISTHPIVFGQLTWIRLVLFGAALLNLAVFLTFMAFPATTFPKKIKKRVKYAVGGTVLVALLTLTPLIFKELKIDSGGSSPVPGPGIPLFMAQTVILLGAAMVALIHKYRTSKGKEKEQFKIIVGAIVGTFSVIVFTNFLLVLLFDVTSLVSFGPAFTLIFSAAFAYAIIRHHLFDIRAAIAKSVAYILIVIAMSGLYALLLYGFVNIVFADDKWEDLRQVVSIILVTPLALSFQYFKNFFDKLTNKLFFRDSYDMQEVLDKIGQIVVAEIELHRILMSSREVLTDALKSSFMEFIVFKNDQPFYEARTQKNISRAEFALASVINTQQKEIALVDELPPHSALYSAFMKVDVALSLKLETHDHIVGYVLFGPKMGGNIYSSQDIKLLSIIANELAIATQNALRFEEIQNFNFTLQAKVNEATHKLQRTNEKLKALDETKDDFISMASHQLRTPLTSVKGYISMVLEEDAGKITPMQREMLGQAFFSSQRMVYLIADLLNVSRLKTGKFIIEPSLVNLSVVIEEELTQLKETAAARQLKLEFIKPKNFPDLMLDETKIRQVIMNFVDNAIYYTPAGGHIKVKLIDEPRNIELQVIDNGLGVPKSEQPHLFTKFYRAGNARKARPDGTGLGLFMAKKVIAAQGGSVVFHSAEGKGSTFGFVFNKHHLAQLAAEHKSQNTSTTSTIRSQK